MLTHNLPAGPNRDRMLAYLSKKGPFWSGQNSWWGAKMAMGIYCHTSPHHRTAWLRGAELKWGGTGPPGDPDQAWAMAVGMSNTRALQEYGPVPPGKPPYDPAGDYVVHVVPIPGPEEIARQQACHKALWRNVTIARPTVDERPVVIPDGFIALGAATQRLIASLWP